MPKSTTFCNDWLKLVFNATATAHGIATVNGVGYALIPPPLPEESRHVPGLTLELSLDKTGLNISV